MDQHLSSKIELPPKTLGSATFLEGASPNMRAVAAVIRELALGEVPVLLLAEYGAGKRTIARRIHESSSIGKEEFRIVGSATLTQDSFEKDDDDLFRRGTIFLEEIGDLSPICQVKMLEMLPKVDESGNRRMQARLICGTVRDLEAEVRSGRFREDLYYRINGVCLRLPPLRQRKEDIADLMNHFLAKYAEDFHRPIPVLSADTRQLFHDYAWPGNVRELENAAKAIVALGDEAVAMGGLRAMLLRPDLGGNGSKVSLKQASRAASREAEKEIILRALTRTRWNRRRAAEELQISYKALLYKLKQMGCSEYGAI